MKIADAIAAKRVWIYGGGGDGLPRLVRVLAPAKNHATSRLFVDDGGAVEKWEHELFSSREACVAAARTSAESSQKYRSEYLAKAIATMAALDADPEEKDDLASVFPAAAEISDDNAATQVLLEASA